MLYSCTHMTTEGVKGLKSKTRLVNLVMWCLQLGRRKRRGRTGSERWTFRHPKTRQRSRGRTPTGSDWEAPCCEPVRRSPGTTAWRGGSDRTTAPRTPEDPDVRRAPRLTLPVVAADFGRPPPTSAPADRRPDRAAFHAARCETSSAEAWPTPGRRGRLPGGVADLPEDEDLATGSLSTLGLIASTCRRSRCISSE